MILLDQTIVAVAMPALQSELHASYSQVLWVNSVYLLFFAVPLLVTGRMGDRWGPRNIYLAGMAVFTAASLACGLAPSIGWLIAARAVQGLGAALLVPQTMSVINRVFPREKRGSALGAWGAVAGIANIAGPLLGGLIMGVASWQWIFFINVPFGILSMLLVARWVPRFDPAPRPIDGRSIMLSMLTMTVLIVAVQEGLWWLLPVAVAGGFVFVRRQRAVHAIGKDPVIPLSLFGRRSFSFGNVSIFAMGFTITALMVPVMLYLQQIHGLAALESALRVMPMAVLGGALAPVVGRLTDNMSPRPLAMIGFAGMAVGVLGLVGVMQPGFSAWWVTAVMVVLGLASPFVWAPNSTVTLRDLPVQHAGAGSGMYNTTRQTGSVLGTAVVGAVLGTTVSPDAAVFGFSLLPAAGLLLVGLWGAYMARDVAEH
ncbi:MAG TPA: MFS transporter [Candidatus Corynebacterium gallistercoris]|uniref:MFS transporter n=1 Tax=Candidatus Corynebacterium gallistercoris TaxID=2838530 RepID=A0A9D1RXC0_9CORY|nr:MFS transporter [Candidatus Corynebacterium gallistercoris]